MTSVKTSGWVEFRFYRPGVQGSRVVGAFNGWSDLGRDPAKPLESHAAIDLAMRPTADGWWIAIVWLPPGDYRFRYVAGGLWYADYAAHGIELDDDGWHSLLNVPERLDFIESEGEPSTKQMMPARMVA